jgi:phosphoesterase RecJ-like protein
MMSLRPDSTTRWNEVISLIQANERFIITSHVNPDCDALGCELALAGYLYQQNKSVVILNSDPVPEAYRFLDPGQCIQRYDPAGHAEVIAAAEVIFVLDASGGWSRTGPVGEALAQARAIKVCIDHHPDRIEFVDLAIIDTDSAATAELIYDLFMTVQAPISDAMAQALYAAIITDSGNFRFPKTSPRTHHVAAALLALGVEPARVYRQIYEQYSLNRVRLKGHVLNSIQTTAGGQIAYYGLAYETLKGYGVQTAELDGFASLGQEIGGVRVVIFCVESSRSKVKISLRSDGSCPVNHIAATYGGGGHPAAAGATVTGRDLGQVLAEVLAQVEQMLVD